MVSLGLYHLGGWQPLEQLSYNFLAQGRAAMFQSDWDDRLAIIAIDEATLKAYGEFPLSRDRYTALLGALEPSPPAVIGFDILFAEPSSKDPQLAQMLLSLGNVVLATAADQQGKLITMPAALANSSTQGHVHHDPDSDGISRQMPIYINRFPSLGIAMLQMYNQVLDSTVTAGQPVVRPIDLPAGLPKTPRQSIWVNWPGRIDRLPTYSFVDVVKGKVDTSLLRDRIVLVGITATGYDSIRSPLNQTPAIGGVYIHAAAIDNLLNQRSLRTLPWQFTVLLLCVMGLVASLALIHHGPRTRLLLLAGMILGWTSVAMLAFALHHWWLPMAAPLGTLLLTGMGIQLREQYEKQQVMSLFSLYLAPETAALIWENRDQILSDGQLAAQELVATVLFMDIRGFTTASEGLQPKELLNWLNRYLDTMTHCIMDHGGVVDKYIGDAIMAVFGVPFARSTQEEIQQDALNAIAASFAMCQELIYLNQQLAAEGRPLIQIGIGIHTGMVVAGSVGGTQRLNYSVVGDTVNVASRLEGLNKQVSTDNPYNLLVSGRTFAYVRHQYDGKAVGAMRLRGRKQNTMVYSILGMKSQVAAAPTVQRRLDLSSPSQVFE